jgi:hypothetical protein
MLLPCGSPAGSIMGPSGKAVIAGAPPFAGGHASTQLRLRWQERIGDTMPDNSAFFTISDDVWSSPTPVSAADPTIFGIKDAVTALRDGNILALPIANELEIKAVRHAIAAGLRLAVGENLRFRHGPADPILAIRLWKDVAFHEFGACSFCGTPQGPTRRHVNGPGGVAICADCVALCNEALADETYPPK